MSDAVARSQAEDIAALKREVNRLAHLEYSVSSAGVTDATALATANKIVLRDGSAGAAFAALTATAITAASLSATGAITSTKTGGGTDAAIVITAANPLMSVYGTSGGSDGKLWDIGALAIDGSFVIRAVNDANTVAVRALTINRTGTTVSSIVLAGAVSAAGGVLLPRSSGATLYAIDASATGSTLTVAAGATATPFGSDQFRGGHVEIYDTTVDGASAAFICGAALTTVLGQVLAVYTNTAATASKVNVYYVAGVLTIQNNTAVSRTFNVLGIKGRG